MAEGIPCGFSNLISLREMHQLEAVGLYADHSKRFPGVIQAVDEVIPGRTVDGAVFSYSAP